MGFVCSSCGGANRDGARFCATCGSRVVSRCATCDADLADGARFCDSCGAPAVAAASSLDDEAGTASRKVVTVVFGDLVGSTALQERMDPESVRSLMGRCYSVLRECVERRGGRVVKFVGDGTMAVFGVPEVAQDDAARALAAGAEMVAAIDELGAELKLRVGINTGEVVVDEDDPDVVGDVVNVAARLEGAALPGSVLVSDATWRVTRHAARFAAAELVPIRGRTDPVVAHPLVAVGAPPEDTTGAAFVGREAELGLLTSAFAAATAGATLRMVTVIGSPGLGKSRLGRELDLRVAGRASSVRVACVADGASAIGPIAELLEVLAAVETTDDERVATVRRGLAAGEAPPPEELFWAVRRSVEAAARQRPLVLQLEDLHWAEPLLLDLVEHLAEWVRTEPVLLVAVARPELREIRPSLTTPRGATHQVLALEGLDATATEALARELLESDDLPAPLVAKLGSATEGNPLFVRELIHMLVDDGVLERGGAGWSLTVSADSVEVPPTIQALLAARIDQLSESERTVLERAAVVGAEVYRGALEALVPAEVAGRLDEVLESLRRKELLEPSGAYWIDERVLRFHHALIRDAAYARLLRGTRARLHQRTARWLDEKTAGSPEHDETVGYHLEQAHACHRALGPLDEDGRAVASEAAARLAAAAARALERDDLAAAASLAARAVACLDTDDVDRGDLLIVQGEALLGDGRVVEAGPVIEELTGLGRGDARLAAWATCFEAQRTTLTTAHGLEETAAELVRVAEKLAELGDQVGAAKAHRTHASVLARLGQVAGTEAALDRALGAARAAGNRRQITSVLTAAPQAALAGPSPVPRAGGRCLDVVRLVRITTGARVVESVSIRCQATLEALRGRFDAARIMLASARHIAEELGSTNGLLENDLSAGMVELYAGHPAAAVPYLERAQAGLATLGIGADAARAAALRARVALELGRDDEALALVDESERLGRLDLRSGITRRAVQAQVLARRGESAEAMRLAEEAVAIAAQTDALVDHGDACAALAVVRRASGDLAGATEAAAKARALYEQKGASALVDLLGTVPHGQPSSIPDEEVAPDLVPVSNAASRAYLEALALIVARRIDEIRPLVTDDIVVDDRREGMGDTVVGAEPTLHMLRVVAGLAVGRIIPTVLAVRGERLAIVASTWVGAFELELLGLVEAEEDGRISRLTNFGPDGLVAALRALSEAYVAGEGMPMAESLQLMQETTDAYHRHDWDRLRSLYAPDITVVDHRPGADVGTVIGAEGLIARHETMAALSERYLLVTRRIIAQTDRVALTDTVSVATISGAAVYRIPRLILTSGTTSPARITAFEYFEHDQLAEARARFEELASGGSEPPNLAARNHQAVFAALRERDWPRVRAAFSEDIVAEDRRPGMWSLLHGPDEVTGSLRSLADLGVERVDARQLETHGDRLTLLHTRWVGSQFEAEALFVMELDAHGRWSVSICFEPEQMTEARAEFEARASRLDGPTHRPTAATEEGPTNAAHRAQRAFLDAVVARDFEQVRALLSAGSVSEDRRPGFAISMEGPDAAVENMRVIADLGVQRVDLVPLVLRGERLVLAHADWRDRDGFVIESLMTYELDEHGLLCRRMMWELEQLDDALRDIEERFYAGEGADHAWWLADLSPRMELEHARRDWDALAASYTPDIEMRDHRTIGIGTVRGREAAIAPQRAMVDLDPGHRLMFRRRLAIADHVQLSEIVTTGGLIDDRGPTEHVGLVLTTHDGQGRISLLERFDITDLERALARFDELVAQGHPQTMAERNVRRVEEALLARDLDALELLYTSDAVGDDRRSTVGIGVSPRETMFQVHQLLMHEQGGLRKFENRVIGRNGEHKVAFHAIWGGSGAIEIEMLFVSSVDARGVCTEVVFFDADKEADALAELAR